jgi:anthranilate synthase/indole-3-glycerol phosphate synthase/phosphoribosylanthranilate isomerase
MVVHSEEGLDEISIAGRTRAWIVADGVIEERELTPEDFGLPRHPLQAVAGGAPPENVATLRAVLAGEEGAVADFVVLNSAAALWVSGLAADLRSAALLARRMLQSGKARQTLEAYVALSRAAAPPAAAGTAAVAVGSPDSVLATIAAHRRDVVTAAAKAALPLDALLLRALASPPPPPLPVLARLRSGGKVALMAEIKRASPSKGVICADADAAQLARVYAAAGAAVISVLTEPKWFRGSVADLRAASRALETVPHRPALLLKDFVMEEYQLVEARASGADLALLIVALLEQPVLERLLRFCWSVGLEALVEVATEDEARRAVAAGARLVGINNRNLHNFSVDMDTTARLIRLLPLERVVVAALSGIQTHEDVARFAATGASAVLVGETLMRSADAAATAAALRGRFAAPLVKVCGVRDADTARAAVAAGADLIGLVFAHSPRQVSAAEAKAIVAAVRSELRLPPSRESPLPALLAAARAAAPSAHIADSKGDDDATKAAAFASLAQCVGVAARQRRPLFVGVFADQSREEVARVAEEVDLDLIQLHGGEGWGAFPAGLPRPVIRAVALGAHDASPAARAWAEADPSHVAAILLDSSSGGGSGRVADWAAAAELSARVPLILAGGLDGDNVAAAIARVRPWGVDASSRLETDGRKDAAKVARFCAAAAALSRL